MSNSIWVITQGSHYEGCNICGILDHMPTQEDLEKYVGKYVGGDYVAIERWELNQTHYDVGYVIERSEDSYAMTPLILADARHVAYEVGNLTTPVPETEEPKIIQLRTFKGVHSGTPITEHLKEWEKKENEE